MKRLFIAEKPDMGKKIAAALGKGGRSGPGYVQVGNDYVSWCIGHLLEQCPPGSYNEAWEKWNMDNLPMIPEKWKLQVSGDKGKQVKVIKELLEQVDEVVNAGDPGREGQLIVDELLQFLKSKKPAKRLILNSLDPKTVQKALQNMDDNKKYFPIYEAGLGRQRADWLIGMNMTQAYTLIGRSLGQQGVLSVGRVQSPTLAIVVRRDEEIENFVPQDYLVIHGDFQTIRKDYFKAKWMPNSQQKDLPWLAETRILDEKEATKIVNKVQGKTGVIRDYETKRVQEAPPLPFELGDMQIYCNSKFGFTAQETLDLCQQLYEAGYLSYPRTDCQYLPENIYSDRGDVLNAIANVPEMNAFCTGADQTLKSAVWDDSKLGEHYGIIPTREIPHFQNDKQKKVYTAAALRYVAQFYPEAEIDKTKIVVVVEQEEFVAQGSVIFFAGWKELFGYEPPKKDGAKAKKKTDDDGEETEEDDDNIILPKVNKDEDAVCIKAYAEKKQTKPPSRFTQGSLIKAMKNAHQFVQDPEMKKKLKAVEGIGRSATRANIIETLLKRALLTAQGKKIISGDNGRKLIQMIPQKLTDPGLTAIWEMALDQVATSKLPFDQFYNKQIAWIGTLVSTAKQSYVPPTPKINANTPSNGTCPKCNKGTMLLRTVKAGKNAGSQFWGCSNYPKCNHLEPKK